MILLSLNSHLDQKVYETIKHLLENLDFGQILITVHESQITQIEKVEKYRFPLKKKQSLKK